MNSQHPVGDNSPVVSTFDLLPQRYSRRGSISSLNSASQADKDKISQALDQINQHASQTDTLTTFNEYTSPPLSSSGGDAKGLAGEIQGGFSGLYKRVRASVGNVRDIVTHAAEHGAADSMLAPSPRLIPPSPTKNGRSNAHAVLSASSSTLSVPATSGLLPNSQTPRIRENYDTSTRPSLGQMEKPSRLVLGSPGIQNRPSFTANLPLKSPLAPLGVSTTAASLAIADREDTTTQVSINAAPAGPSSRAEEQLHEAVNKQKTSKDQYSEEIIEHTAEAIQSLSEDVGGRRNNERKYPDSSTTETLDYFTPVKHSAEPPKIMTHAATPQQNHQYTPLDTHDQNHSRNELSGHQKNRSIDEDPLKTASPAPSTIASPASTQSPVTSQHSTSQQSGITQSMMGRVPKQNVPSSKLPNLAYNNKSHFPQKNRVLSKQFWMKDENARDCFYCGDTFSTFRRKHHCRTCGQIFDAKCTSILPGAQFDHGNTIRVCKPCEGIINGYDDSSEFSDDSSVPPPSLRPRHGSTGASDALGSPGPRSRPGSLRSSRQSPKHSELTAPTMSIPATRKYKSETSKTPSVLEIDAERTLLRPSSSRSLRSQHANRPFTPGHRRHNSRNLLQRGFKPLPEDSAPFHQNVAEVKSQRLPAFHDDNIIDPDLAPYLSDDASSGDEQIGIEAAMHGEMTSRSFDEKTMLAGYLGHSKKGRSRAGDKGPSGVAFTGRDTDTHSITSTKTPNARSSRRRNLSTVGNLYMRPSPRTHRMSAAIPVSNSNLHESFSSSALAQMMSTTAAPATGPRMIRSSSMRGDAAPAIELNSASLQHVRKLLRQLLQDSRIPSVARWEKALVPILLQATDDINPDVQNGDDIDIRHYVKLKKIPGGRPDDTLYVSGLVFTKNLALKSMPRSIDHPSILILTFPLEYARHQQHFMSLEPVIRQEREFLQNLVSRIAALRPKLLLVERNVSGLALEFLEKANIATAYNVKASVLEAVSRCSQTRILSSIDKLAIKPPQAGQCSSFYLKTYVHGGRKKTYMFLSGCAKELGCTIVLRGASDSILAKMKKITEFMVYVVYNLKLETCLMRDEFALIPSVSQTGTLSPGQKTGQRAIQASSADPAPLADTITQTSEKFLDVETNNVRMLADISNADVLRSQDSAPVRHKDGTLDQPEDNGVPEDIPMPTFYSDMVEEHRTKILSASPFIKFMQPYLLMRTREQERRLAYLRRLRDLDFSDPEKAAEKIEVPAFELIKPEMVHEKVQAASKSVREVLRAVHDAEYDKALHNYHVQSKQWETYIAGNINLFDPRAHQNIAVLYSVVCTVTTIPCSGPDMLALGFYNEHEVSDDFEADCTLGQYVEDICLGANTVCTANGCERKMFEHHRQYVHGEAQISVFVERYPCKLRGLQNTILMWSCCRICNKETQVMPMSESTWKYSFGKYLELSFWSKDIHARADVCPHDLHRDHLRFFGFKDLALRVHYDPITLLEVIVPRARITWKVDNDLKFKNDLFSRIEERINKFMNSVKARIHSILIESVVPEKMEACRQEVTKLMERAREEHRALIQKLQEKYMNSKHYETVPFNRAIRATQEKVVEWDKTFADFDRNFFPSEKDIRRLATLQLKRLFLDRDESSTPLSSNDLPHSDDDANGSIVAETLQSREVASEKTHEMLAAVADGNGKTISAPPTSRQLDMHESNHAGTVSADTSGDSGIALDATEREEVRHLDLATSTELRPHSAARDALADGEPRAIDFAQKFLDPPSPQVARSSTNIEAPLQQEPSSEGEVWKGPSTIQQRPVRDAIKPKINHASGIPRPTEGSRRQLGINIPPPLHRAHSQPVNHQIDQGSTATRPDVIVTAASDSISKLEEATDSTSDLPPKPEEKKLSDRLGLSAIKPSNVLSHSMIPRSIASRKDSHVSSLAKHFEQLSREFEKERQKERRQRFSKSRQSRAYPMAAAKPIVEVYHNVSEAVEEHTPSDEDLLVPEQPADIGETPTTVEHMAKMEESQTSGETMAVDDTTAENTETEEQTLDSRIGSDTEGEMTRNEADRNSIDEITESVDEQQAMLASEAQLDIKIDLPKHEKTSLMKILTNFWAERSASGWKALDYPLNIYDHIFADSDVIVREDEPSSLIAFALGSEDYQSKLRSMTSDAATSGEDQAEMQRTMLRTTGTHLKYQFQEGSAKMLCKVFYAEQFDAVRRKCGLSERIVESLSRCLKWDSKGGKTKSVFLKTLDDRFVLKSLPPGETQTFLRFAPAYFQLMSECLFHDLPSVIAKMLGFYQIVIKNPLTGVDFNWYLILMENLFYDRSPTRIFDLKGSMRNRRIQSTGEQNEVLLDENMVEFIYESPLFSREHSKKLLRASVWNDTLFLSRQNVMDYSLMIAIDEERRELVVGIIDCIRTYTWDKKLEFWTKNQRGRSRPTVTSPRDYKNRFREAMGRYVLQAPK
ncbi:MAG: hypothetical protein Q9222_005710 [Ikaeria aurantiellina]